MPALPRCHRRLVRLGVAAWLAGAAVMAVAMPASSQVAKVAKVEQVGRPAGAVADAARTPAAPRKPAPPKPVVLRLTYTVVAGDSLAGIARRHGVRLDDLRKLNRLKRRSLLLPGRVLRVPPIVVPGGLASRLPAVILQRPERLRLVPLFLTAAREFAVPPDLLMAVAFRESNWNPAAVSRTGAMGVGQLMPDTVRFVSLRLLRLPRPLNPWEPVDNIRMSARTLRQLLDLSGHDPGRTLAAYYQGYGSVTHQGILPVGRAYAQSVLALRAAFQG